MKRELILKNKIKEYRAERGWSQEELAKKCFVSRNTITSIERYEYYPSAYLAYIICEVLEKDFKEVFSMEEKQIEK